MGHRSRKKKKSITGILTLHPDGYGFLAPEGGGPDIFIPPRKSAGALHGDRVRAELLPPRHRKGRRKSSEGPAARVVEILARSQLPLLGKLFFYRGEPHLAPLDNRHPSAIRLQRKGVGKEMEGKIVGARVVSDPDVQEPLSAQVVEVLGDADDPEIQYRITCYRHQIPTEFPEPVLREAKSKIPPSREEIAGRKDLREATAVTIDGPTARDFDDAVSIEQGEAGGFLLGVHIADVSHYVHPGGELDREARNRGTSVYFPDRAIPMLPEKLSNDLCSLRPQEDRLTVSVFVDVGPRGEVRHVSFAKSVIRSRRRMTYGEVKKITVDQDPELREKYDDLLPQLDWMLQLSRILQKKRRQQGAIDFDLPEAEVEYSLDGEVYDIIRAERNEAHRLIEEFMLLANECVARYLIETGTPSLHRVHEEPDEEKVEQFAEIALKFGHSLRMSDSGEVSPAEFQRLARRVQGTPEERFLSYLMLRSFQQARYSDERLGHFGLATTTYTHFTSSIRRYPDLVVHRILKARLEDRLEDVDSVLRELPGIADFSSQRERKAVDAEREIMRWIMAEFMAEKVGDEFEAFIFDIRDNGFYVELVEHFVEGFVPVEVLWDDFYIFHEKDHCLVGENTGTVYRIGDRLQVRLDRVNRDRNYIDFSIVISD